MLKAIPRPLASIEVKNMNGKDKERSFSEVGDTLRYFNSMASSHSWCCTDYDEPAMALMGLNQLDMPIDGAAMATAAAKAIAVAAAVSCENFVGGSKMEAVDEERGFTCPRPSLDSNDCRSVDQRTRRP